MTRGVTSKFVVPTVFAIALGITISFSAVKYLVPVDQAEASHSIADSRGIVEVPNPQLSRVRLLLSSMK